MKFYLAGKVKGIKWALVPACPRNDYVASDGYINAGSERYTAIDHGYISNPTEALQYWGKPHDNFHVATDAARLKLRANALCAALAWIFRTNTWKVRQCGAESGLPRRNSI